MANPTDVQEGYGGLEGGGRLHVPAGNSGGRGGGVLQPPVNNNSWWKKFCRLFTMDYLGEFQWLPASYEDDADAAAAAAAAAANNTWWRRIFPLGRLNEVVVVDDAGAAAAAAAAANNRWWRRIIPLGRHCSTSDNALGACLDTMASIMVMAVLTLNIFSATYFLAWAKDSSYCIVASTSDLAPAPASGAAPSSGLGLTYDLPEEFKVGLKITAVSLPFALVPLTLCVSGTTKAAQKAGRGLGFAAGLILGEIAYVLVLGGLMMVCMSNSSYNAVAGVTLGLIIGLVWIWGCVFKHPKCLRACAYPRCCCPEYDDLEANAGAERDV